MVAAELSVKGLRGGHSGLEIDKGRGNAIKIINRVLRELAALGSKLSAINGGNKRNALPRECTAFLYIPKKNLADAKKIVAEYNSTVIAELATLEKDLVITIVDKPREKKAKMLKEVQQANNQQIPDWEKVIEENYNPAWADYSDVELSVPLREEDLMPTPTAR